ncbi:protein tyrosine phosphatase family protein [Pleurocapsales cyanobacterium LEGE 10410]|nr:protein tyrosine phosphatase family protein [Pleurocapsales cyanobacterium LEGE 10410]
MIEKIRDYYPINLEKSDKADSLATSGQPTPKQFSLIAQAGYQAVINLALPSSTDALVNEGAIVTNLGMVYVHIPVVWEEPKLEDVKLFFEVMDSLKNYRVWVHCAKNMRVSCFVYLWQKHVLQLPEERARYPMAEIWQPTGVWQELIAQAETNLNLGVTSKDNIAKVISSE